MTTSLDTRLNRSLASMHEPLGGVLCLDFANSVEPRGGPPPIPVPPGVDVRDELQDYDDLVGWSVHKGALDRRDGLRLMAEADRDPATASTVVDRALALRDAMYRLGWAIAHQEVLPIADLEIVRTEYADAVAHALLVDRGDEAGWEWLASDPQLARPLWPVAQSAIDLITTGDRARIKVCPGPGRPPLPCAWLFYDTTRNGSRRWCSMADCGAATKIQLQSTRRRATRQRTTSPSH